MSCGTLSSLVEQASQKRKRDSHIYKEKGRDKEFKPKHTRSRIQKAVGKDWMFSRQFVECSVKKEGIMWENNKMKDWKNSRWSDKFGSSISDPSILQKQGSPEKLQEWVNYHRKVFFKCHVTVGSKIDWRPHGKERQGVGGYCKNSVLWW